MLSQHWMHFLTTDKSTTQSKKIRTFNAYVASVFIYNSESWTLTKKKLENTVNTFRRRHLKKILPKQWPKNITNIELYIKTDEWSTTIRWHLNWLGRLMRLHPCRDTSQTRTRWISEESQTTQRKTTACMAGTDQTWSEKINIILNYKNPNQMREQLTRMAHARYYWRDIVRRVVLQK